MSLSDIAQPDWQQLSLTFTEPHMAERHFRTHLGPTLRAAETEHLITAWFFIRKHPWRLRYLPTDSASTAQATARLHKSAHTLHEEGAAHYHETIYEPETHAFGGTQGMHAAHRLFHADSRNILAHLDCDSTVGSAGYGGSGKRREVSLLLCTALMRAAGLDRYEQGDIWARIAAHRPHSSPVSPQQWHSLTTAVHRLTTVDTAPETLLRTEALDFANNWLTTFEHAGHSLHTVAESGHLTRGLRAVITHHIIFHWNRLGLTYPTQAALAQAATEVAFADPRDLPATSHPAPTQPVRNDS